MKFFTITLSCFFLLSSLSALTQSDCDKLGEKIFRLECGGKKAALAHWNLGECFPSFGIGHFIWFPEGAKIPFEETFPSLLIFMQNKGTSLPVWLEAIPPCPWKTEGEFWANWNSPALQELREFLWNTRGLQALFIAERFEKTLPQVLDKVPPHKKKSVQIHLDKLTKTPEGLFALIDYVHFKGSGLTESEQYQGEGWGLLQVLLAMPDSSNKPLPDFVDAAKERLRIRVKNAPPERHEERWLKGWEARLDSYLN